MADEPDEAAGEWCDFHRGQAWKIQAWNIGMQVREWLCSACYEQRTSGDGQQYRYAIERDRDAEDAQIREEQITFEREHTEEHQHLVERGMEVVNHLLAEKAHEPMTNERLAEIRDRWQWRKKARVMTVYGQSELFRQWLDHVADDETALLAEVERLQALVDGLADDKGRMFETVVRISDDRWRVSEEVLRLQAEISMMRPIVEAVTKLEPKELGTDWGQTELGYAIEDVEPIVDDAYTYVAAHPAAEGGDA